MNGIKPLNLVIIAAVIAVAGTWSKKRNLDQRQIIGGAVLALTFAILGEAQPKLAEPLAYLILVSVISSYGEQLFSTVGDVVSGKPQGQPGTKGVINEQH